MHTYVHPEEEVAMFGGELCVGDRECCEGI